MGNSRTGSGRKRVLAVLRDEQTAPLFARLIDPRFDLQCCPDGGAVERALASGVPVAAVLCDPEVSDAAGLELLGAIARQRPEVRRVLVVRGEDPDGLETALEDEIVHYVLRSPLHREPVRRAMAMLLESFDRDLLSAELLAGLRQLSARPDADLEPLEALARDLELSAFRDPATGLYRPRAFRERLGEELGRSRRYRQPLSLITLDVDDLESLNQKSGYDSGDRVLATIAAILRAGARDSDVAARIGGQEFALLLPDTDKQGGEVKADRLRETIEAHDFEGLEVTASFGVSTYPSDGESADELLRAAAQARRDAKREGKNRVCRAAGPSGDGSTTREEFTYYHGHLAEITATLERDLSVSCLFVDLSQLRRIEREFGVNAHAELFARAGELLGETRGTCLRKGDRLFRTEDADGYLAFLSPPRDHSGTPAPLDLDRIAHRVQEYLTAGLTEEVARLTREPPRFVVGYARVLANPMARPERLIIKVIADARASAHLIHQRNALRDKTLLQDIILRRQLTPVYQPIVQLESGDIFGFETLTRGPAGTSLESPTALFAIADEVDLTFELDRACFRNGLRGAEGLSPVHRLFVNLLPQSFYDTRFIEGEVERLLENAGLTPANVVFEITERLAIENFTAFRQALATYTAMGFGVAIDDVGTRHSNLETVMALRPHFIKVSDILTRGVAGSTVKREMLRSLQRIASAIDAVIVAEGIETVDDLAVLGEVGVRYGQGYYLARPGPALPELKVDRQEEIRNLAAGAVGRTPTLRLQPPIEELERSALGRGSGEYPIPPGVREEKLDEEIADETARIEDEAQDEITKQELTAPDPEEREPWRPLSPEELGRPEGGDSLLDALRQEDAEATRKESLS